MPMWESSVEVVLSFVVRVAYSSETVCLPSNQFLKKKHRPNYFHVKPRREELSPSISVYWIVFAAGWIMPWITHKHAQLSPHGTSRSNDYIMPKRTRVLPWPLSSLLGSGKSCNCPIERILCLMDFYDILWIPSRPVWGPFCFRL